MRVCQARRNQWRLKKVKRGRYSLPSQVIVCKLTHHVGTALHIPQQRGGTVSARNMATLALCQRQARHILAGNTPTGTWILMLGAANVDGKYRQQRFHKSAEWKQHVAGKLLACARVDKVLSPEEAKSKFGPLRADTGTFLSCLCPCTLVSHFQDCCREEVERTHALGR